MKNLSVISIFLTALFCASSCKESFKTELYSHNENYQATIPEEFQELISSSSNDCTMLLEYSVELPADPVWSEAREIIIEMVAGEAPGHDKEAIDNDIKMWKDNFDENNEDYFQSLAEGEEIDYNQLTNKIIVKGNFMEKYDRYRTYLLYHYDYLGGDHGLENKTYVVFDDETGKDLDISDFFAKENKDRLYKALSLKLLGLDGIDAEILDESSIITGNFYVGGEGVTFVYQPYELSYSSGDFIEATLSWDEVNDINKNAQ